MSDISELLESYRRFVDPSLTSTLSKLEIDLRGATSADLGHSLSSINATEEALSASLELKRLVGQINVAIHALGILMCLPHILEPGEMVEFLSLGAGNTGRAFDLETDRRVAEFKFITWKGGAETIRQNSVFKDFFLLAEHPTKKRKFLYLLDTERPIRFLNGGRALCSVLKDARLAREFRKKHQDKYRTVSEYFTPRQHLVSIENVSGLLPKVFVQVAATEPSLPSDENDPILKARPGIVSNRPSGPSPAVRGQLEAFDGKHLQTASGGIGFRVDVSERGLAFIPDSTRKRRMEAWHRVERVLRRYGETESLRPKDYLDITRNSSYLLPVIRDLLSEPPAPGLTSGVQGTARA